MQTPLRLGEENYVRVDDDPWGTKYRMMRTEDGIRIESNGPDGKRGTDDDIAYPEE